MKDFSVGIVALLGSLCLRPLGHRALKLAQEDQRYAAMGDYNIFDGVINFKMADIDDGTFSSKCAQRGQNLCKLSGGLKHPVRLQ